jgi:hypothetical protein
MAVKVCVARGVNNKRLGITPDTEIGYLYETENKHEALKDAAMKVGLNPNWMRAEDTPFNQTGFICYLTFRSPLSKARKLFPVVEKAEFKQDYERIVAENQEVMAKITTEVKTEARKLDDIIQNVGFKEFFSRSKGRGRKRRNWADVKLYRYAYHIKGRGWHTLKKFPYDEYKDEVAWGVDGGRMDAEEFLAYIERQCNEKGGCYISVKTEIPGWMRE